MALPSRVYDLTQIATAELRIGGVRIDNWITMRGGDSEDNPVPFLDIVVPDYSAFSRGQLITLDAGYSNEHIRLFTGGLFARGDEDPDSLRTQALVRGRTDSAGGTISSLASVITPPPMWPPIPAGQRIDFEISNSLIWEQSNADEIAGRELSKQAGILRRPSGNPLNEIIHALGDLKGAYRSYKIPARDLSGQTVKEAAASVLDDSGVAEYVFNFDDYSLAPTDVLVDRAPGSHVLNLLMTLVGASPFQLRSGTVSYDVVDERPASTAAFYYDSTDLSLARVIENPNQVKVPFNPLLQRGMTIGIIDEATHITGLWYLRGHQWELGATGDWSYLDLIGGDELGVSIGINPRAVFTYSVDLEYIGGVLTANVQFDAQSSFDGDSTLTDADISWSDNQTPNLISGTGFRKTVRVAIEDIVEPWIVTATATDSDGLTGIEAHTIDTSLTGSTVHIPAIGVASDTHGMFSGDSAGAWVDDADSSQTAVGLRPADGVHFGHGVYGFADGSLELTRDGNVTRISVLAAVGSPFVFIAWDWRNTLVCWALTADLRLYTSINMDDAVPTFGLYGGQSLRTTLALPAAHSVKGPIGLPAGGGVYVFGGNGNGFPLIAYDAAIDNHWVTQILLGDILTDGAGDPSLSIYDFTAPGDGGATMILTNAGGRANGSIAIYHSTSEPGPSATYVRATGLPAGLVDGRAMLANGPLAAVRRIAIFADAGSEDSVFKSNDGIAYTETTAIIPAGFTCNHAMWLSDILTGLPAFDGIYLLALENGTTTGGIYKSVDEFNSEVEPLRDSTSDDAWPLGARALQISLGAPAQTTSLTDERIVVINDNATPREITTKLGVAAWSSLIDVTTIDSDAPRLYPITESLWFCANADQASFHDYGVGARSLDGGATWAAAVDPGNILGAVDGDASALSWARDAGGRLWEVTMEDFGGLDDGMGIYYSDDDGDTWTLATSRTADSGNVAINAWKILPHPTNQNIIVVMSSRRQITTARTLTYYTLDRGATWNVNDDNPETLPRVTTGITNFYTYDAIILPNNRIIVSRLNPGSDELTIWRSDNFGASWTQSIQFGTSPEGARGTRLYANAGGTIVALLAQIPLADTWVLLRSTDGGVTFNEIDISDQFPVEVVDDTPTATAVSANADAIYIKTNQDSGQPFAVIKVFPIMSGTPTITDLTENYPATQTDDNCIAVIP